MLEQEKSIEYPKQVKEIFKKARVVILVPVFARIDFRFLLSVCNLIGHSTQNGIHYVGMTVAHRSKTVAARNRLVESVKGYKDITHYLWIDDDHTFKPNILCNLLARERDYIAPLMFQKLPPHYPTIYQVDPERKHGYHAFIKWPKAIFEVSATGFGMVLMKKSLMDKIKPPYFEETTGEYGQDLHFCSKLRDLGIRMFCDGTQDVKHITYVAPDVGIEEFMKYQQGELDKVKSHLAERGIKDEKGGIIV